MRELEESMTGRLEEELKLREKATQERLRDEFKKRLEMKDEELANSYRLIQIQSDVLSRVFEKNQELMNEVFAELDIPVNDIGKFLTEGTPENEEEKKSKRRLK